MKFQENPILVYIISALFFMRTDVDLFICIEKATTKKLASYFPTMVKFITHPPTRFCFSDGPLFVLFFVTPRPIQLIIVFTAFLRQ